MRARGFDFDCAQAFFLPRRLGPTRRPCRATSRPTTSTKRSWRLGCGKSTKFVGRMTLRQYLLTLAPPPPIPAAVQHPRSNAAGQHFYPQEGAHATDQAGGGLEGQRGHHRRGGGRRRASLRQLEHWQWRGASAGGAWRCRARQRSSCWQCCGELKCGASGSQAYGAAHTGSRVGEIERRNCVGNMRAVGEI